MTDDKVYFPDDYGKAHVSPEEQADADDPMTGEGNASTAAERPVKAPTLFERFGEWLTR